MQHTWSAGCADQGNHNNHFPCRDPTGLDINTRIGHDPEIRGFYGILRTRELKQAPQEY